VLDGFNINCDNCRIFELLRNDEICVKNKQWLHNEQDESVIAKEIKSVENNFMSVFKFDGPSVKIPVPNKQFPIDHLRTVCLSKMRTFYQKRRPSAEPQRANGVGSVLFCDFSAFTG
jgi:hypothetical protein